MFHRSRHPRRSRVSFHPTRASGRSSNRCAWNEAHPLCAGSRQQPFRSTVLRLRLWELEACQSPDSTRPLYRISLRRIQARLARASIPGTTQVSGHARNLGPGRARPRGRQRLRPKETVVLKGVEVHVPLPTAAPVMEDALSKAQNWQAHGQAGYISEFHYTDGDVGEYDDVDVRINRWSTCGRTRLCSRRR